MGQRKETAIAAQPRHNLTAEVTSLVGRIDDQAQVRARLGQARLVTLLGPGGVGKSRLARAVGMRLARAFDDGVWLVDLASVPAPEFVARAIADAVPEPGGALSLVEQLAGRRALLILDNCDHLHEAVGDVAADLLAGCPSIVLLATSRVPLDISAEHIYSVEPLPVVADVDAVPDAVVLFRNRALAASGWDCSDVPVAEIAALCAHLDGLPLAIELAALHTRTLTIAEIEARLDHPFDLLRDGPRDLHPRHRSLWTLLEWTWLACSPDERSLWTQLSVFAGPATAATIRSVCALGSSRSVDDALNGLVAQSVLSRRRAGSAPRFAMLVSFREFGRVKLDAEGASLPGGPTYEAVRAAHLDHYLRLAVDSEARWFGPTQVPASQAVAAEIADLRAAFEYALDADVTVGSAERMFATLWFRWLGCGRLSEGLQWAALLTRRSVVDDPAALWTLGWLNLITGDLDRAELYLRACVERAEIVDAGRAGGFGQALLGAVAIFRGEFDAGQEQYRDAIAGARVRGDDLSEAMFLYQLAEAHCLSRDLDITLELCAQGLVLCERNGDRWCASYLQWVQGLAAYQAGDDDHARELIAVAVGPMRELGDHLGLALVNELGAWIAARTGMPREAMTVLGATAKYWTISGSMMMGVGELRGLRAGAEREIARQLSASDISAASGAGGQLSLERVSERVPLQPGEPTSSPAAKGIPGIDLTRREEEIAALVAEGLTNREIAERLVIGKRTVDTHVAHILAKWGLRRRSEIVALIAGRAEK
ncbi:hypothetical protein HH308_20330 [Gordonia sp. TBRC 11910]|uniref:HTH luxR-type domain-containing protein n=1 Tax=Gordonia asplenii TaxID=2725283 RepID=A0A848KZI3_9ACTN|nr:LuxR C-terminal-related transcriptional regulator [Gordonia asplenii]NMO03567.1 hypothetical protein [Gordonia asplenii]